MFVLLILTANTPERASGDVIGELDGVEFGIVRLRAHVTREAHAVHVRGNLTDVPQTVGAYRVYCSISLIFYRQFCHFLSPDPSSLLLATSQTSVRWDKVGLTP